MDAARDLFARDGYEAMSMRKLAETIEYSPTAIYAYFKDKEDLLRQICRDDFDKFQQRTVAASSSTDPVERVLHIGRTYIQFAVENPNHFRRMFLIPPELEPTQEDLELKGDPTRDGYAYFRSTVAEAVREGRFRKELKNDVELITQTLWAAVHGVAAICVTYRNDAWVSLKSNEDLIQAMTSSILRGMLNDDDRFLQKPSPRKVSPRKAGAK